MVDQSADRSLWSTGEGAVISPDISRSGADPKPPTKKRQMTGTITQENQSEPLAEEAVLPCKF